MECGRKKEYLDAPKGAGKACDVGLALGGKFLLHGCVDVPDEDVSDHYGVCVSIHGGQDGEEVWLHMGVWWQMRVQKWRVWV